MHDDDESFKAIAKLGTRMVGSDLARQSLGRLRDKVRTVWQASVAHAKLRGTPIRCAGLGCNGCCRGEVVMMPDEATMIADLFTDDQLAWVVANRDLAADINRRREVRCPLLAEDGGCSIYEQRPLACRGFNSTGDPDLCWPERSGLTSVPRVAEPMAISVAILTSNALAGLRPVMLLDVMLDEARIRGLL